MKPIDLNFTPLGPGEQIGDGLTVPGIGLWSPWGSAIAIGKKKNETRSWYRGFRGLLAIYQTKTAQEDGRVAYEHWQSQTGDTRPFGLPALADCPLGAVVALCRVAGGYAAPVRQVGKDTPPPLEVRFLSGDGRIQTRQIPPPEETPEAYLGYYNSSNFETRYAWLLTDVWAVPEPLVLAKEDTGGSRQGIFRIQGAAAQKLLTPYREWLVGLRPKCEMCGLPLGENGPDGTGWRWQERGGWLHNCTAGNGIRPFDCLKNPDLAERFRGGPLRSAPAPEAGDEPAVPTIPKSLFDYE